LTRRPSLLASSTALLAVAFGVGGAVAWYGGAIGASGWSGLIVDTGWTPFLLPAARLAMDIAAVVTVGCLIAAAFFVPGRDPDADRAVDADRDRDAGQDRGRRPLVIAPAARGWVHGAGWAAAAWAASALASMCLTVSDLVGLPVGQAVTFRGLASLAIDTETGRALFAVLVLTSAVAAACQYLRTVTSAALTALVAVVAVLPPAFSGHAASSGNHQLAVSTLVLHVVGAVLWTGGLVALVLGRRRPVRDLAASVARFSRLAGWCFVLVTASGVVIAVVRLFEPRGLASTFGVLVLGKVGALVLLGGFGWWHRRRSIPLLAAGDRGVFTRVAGVESLVLAATFGLAVALSRTPSPAGDSGYRLSPFAPVLDVLPEPVFLATALSAIGAYLAGVQRLRDRDRPWPAARMAAWLAGWVVILLSTDLDLALQSGRFFSSIEKVQHLAMIVVVPLLLVSAAPLTLARQALRPASEPGMRGPLEWLSLLGTSSAVRRAAHPVVALAWYAGCLSLMYLNAYGRYSLRAHASHLVIFGLALLSGAFLFAIIRGLPAGPAGSPGTPADTRPAMHVTAGVLQLILGVALILPASPGPATVALALALPVAALSLWSACRPAEQPTPGPRQPLSAGIGGAR